MESNEALPLRRTIIGSFSRSPRPISPVLSPSAASTPSLFRNETRGSTTYTSAKFKHSLALSLQHAETPRLDRVIDLFCLGNATARIDQGLFCDEILSSRNAMNAHQSYLSGLPAIIRRRIYNYCFKDEPRKISLSPRFATKAVFPDGYLASPWDVLEPVFGGLHAFSVIRRELMIFFWTQYSFHITLSPFTGPAFSPLSSVWLPRYIQIVQYLSVEADLTRFGFGHSKPGAKFGHNVNKTEVLLVGIVKGLAKRRGKTTMAELNVMCRRYAGFRPCDDLNSHFDYDSRKFPPLFMRSY